MAILEKEIELDLARIWVHNTKDGEAKYLYLLLEDVSLLKEFPLVKDAMLPVFRHEAGHGGVSKGARYGEKYFYKYWKHATGNLGIHDVDMYGGTRHSTAHNT